MRCGPWIHRSNLETTPLALRANLEHNLVIHACVVIISVETLRVPHVAEAERVSVDELGYRDDGITHLRARFGFQDTIDVPSTLRMAADRVEGEIDVDSASYFLSRITIVPTRAPGMAMWRKKLFVLIARNAANPVAYFGLPDERTIVMSSHIVL
jgi:KUP system potassium uptake protein